MRETDRQRTLLTAHTVLLVDDVLELRMLIRLTLEEAPDFEIIGEAGDGLEAVEKVSELSPDLVLLDLSMPRMDGIEALPRILAASPKSAVVVLTGFEADHVRTTALERGAVAVLEKGISPSELVHELRSVMDRLA